ncbi:MAG TPA: ComEC/Rec2 family competence protein [Planctomycetota bacterium]|jgi:competence protein ComEC
MISPAGQLAPTYLIATSTIEPAAAFQRRRPLFWLALAFCAGITCDAFLAPVGPTLGGMALAALLGITALLFSGSAGLRAGGSAGLRAGRGYLACGLALAFTGGMLTHAFRARIPRPDDVSRRTPAAPSFVFLRGRVLDVDAATATGRDAGATAGRVSITLSVQALGLDENALSAASGRVRLTWPVVAPASPPVVSGEPCPSEGDVLALRARLEAPPEITLPDSFDTAAWMEKQDIRRVGAVFPQSVQRVSGCPWWRADLACRALSSKLAARIEETMAPWSAPGRNDGSQAALMNALLFGRRQKVDRSDREAFTVSGTAHLLAISGLQIQFFAFVLWQISARAGVSRRKSAFGVLLLCCAYCVLAGSDPPILRATVMIALYLGALVFRREPDPLSTLGAAALSILAFSPAELFNAGFQLSFLAVLALFTLYPAMDAAWAQWRQQRNLVPDLTATRSRWKDWLAEFTRTSLFVSLAAWLGTAPVVAWHMGRFATYSLAVNLVAVPLSSLCMVAGLALLAASVFGVLVVATAWLAFASIFLLQKLIEFFAALPGATLDLPAPAWPLALCYTAVLVWIWTERGRQATFAKLAVLCPACLAALCAGMLFREPPPSANITVLDLKRGRAALVEASTGGAALIDAGGPEQGVQIAEILRRRGIRHLALLVLTADEPEALDGALDLIKHVPAGRVILPRDISPSSTRRELERYLAERNVPYGPPDVSQALQGPADVRWEFCDDGPPPEKPAVPVSGIGGPRTALCVRVAVPGVKALFVDARSGASLQRLQAQCSASGRSLQADVLRLSAGAGGRWPAECTQIIRQSQCKVVIAGSGSDPEETPGLDLSALAEAQALRLLAPHRNGSLRLQADNAAGSALVVQAFRKGVWQEIP